ncbi:MAG: hypothetical protein O7G13_04990 [Alphaproteobacteria bacterium]|nr:hypothetical protein [Alphaproteobacteria bacterium]
MAQSASTTVYGQAQNLGDGFAQLYAELDANSAPRVLGVSIDGGMLENLPAKTNNYSRCFDKNGNGKIDATGECNGDFELTFPVPQELAGNGTTPFKWVSVNWNPAGHGHPAPPPWEVPHFDFHFYIQSREDVRAIRPGKCSELIDCEDFKRAQIPVPKQLVHADHIDVGAAVPDMGNHLINKMAPELAPKGPKFTHTFIFGAYDGDVTFYEPMITRVFLAGKPDICVPIKQPQA